MSQHQPVPRLDLAPKLRRPLSLWNPLDYLRLLYWVFFFPQALRWYVDTFGDGYIPPGTMTWRKAWELLRKNPIQRQLLLQGLVLTVTALVLGAILQRINSPIPVGWFNVAHSVAFSMMFSVVLSVTFGVAFGVAFSVAWSVAFSVIRTIEFNLAISVTLSVESDAVIGVVLHVLHGMVLGVVLNAILGVAGRMVLGMMLMSNVAFGRGVGGCVVLGMMLMWGVGWIVVLGLPFGLTFVLGLPFGLTFGVVILRPENWLLGLPLATVKPQNGNWSLPHVTPLPLYSLSSELTNWLRQDWERGLHNANQLLGYTLQFIPVVQAVSQVLAETPPEQVILRLVQLAEASFDWKLVPFSRWQRRLQDHFVTNALLNTPARATAAGFWHLYEKEPAKAMKAFAVVRSLLYGEEMFILAQTLAAFHDAKELATIVTLQVPAFPKEPLLRSATWETLTSLRRVVEDVHVVQGSASRSARAFALNRALGELIDIADNKAETLPRAERGLITDIARTWAVNLLLLTAEVGEISITKPVTNPYVVGDPVEGNLFVGREDILRQLEELWVMGHQLQSVVLYGHRRMGKTSILLNAANCSGSGVKVAYVNLLRLGDSPQGVGEVLMAITDAISEAVGCTPPSDTDLLNLPYRTFERYLKQVEAHLSGGLIVALDEFEKIEELIEAEKIPKDFMGYLRGLVQMSSKVAFAFAGLHTLEEMTADYFQPFFASVIPIHVDFLQPGATRQILANPDEDFPLDYTPEALDQIYALTAGQPYLVQLVGFQLVRRYNDFVFEQGRPRNPVFTVEDVEAVINDPEFFKRGRYYFDGVWGQAARGASGQQAILKALAPHPDPEGLSLDELRTQLDGIVGVNGRSPLQEETLQDALKTLMRHDVIREREGCWQIIVELFRRWVVQN